MIRKPLLTLAVTISTVLGAACVQNSEPTQPARVEVSPQSLPEQAVVIEEDRSRLHREAERKLMPAGPAIARQAAKMRAASALMALDLAAVRMPVEAVNRENYAHFVDNPVRRVAEHPLSTFSIDVDSGAYSNVRRMLNAGQLPVRDAVRVEEMINYFAYDYPLPVSAGTPFRVSTEIGPNPWNSATRLLHVGIKGYDIDRRDLPPANLVFLVDVSGSMRSPDKLDLLKSALKLLTRQLRRQDRISLVVYAGASGVVLEPVSGSAAAKIQNALESLAAGGSTNGAAGIRLAYRMAEQAFIEDGINRVIIATDGDFNVGTVSFEALLDLVREKRKSGIALTTLGFGSGNYNDRLMEQLADVGNGNYAYIDTLNEAQKVLVDEMGSTLQTIASDVKIQIEFNPAVVAEYRLIGYENRALQREDFSNDKVDAGDIGAGHTLTALYEIALVGAGGQRIEALRYRRESKPQHGSGKELALLRLRYKQPGEKRSRLIEAPLYRTDIESDLGATSDRFRFAAAVAGFGQLLRGGKYVGDFDYPAVLELARRARGPDRFGYRGEFIQLVNLSASLQQQQVRVSR